MTEVKLSNPVFFKLFSSRPIFHRQIFSRFLKKDLHLESISDSAIFSQKSRCSLKKKKKSLYFDFISDFPIFLPKSRCSLKKKKQGLHFDFMSDFPVFLPKSRCSLKKKKGLHFNLLLHFAFFSQSRDPVEPFRDPPGGRNPQFEEP